MNYQDLKQHPTNFLALTSLTLVEFDYLLKHFDPCWEKYYKHYTLEGKKRILPAFTEHGNALLKGTHQKLFFLLVYMKNNPLQTFQASSFGLSQAKVSKIYRALLAVLDHTLIGLKLAPCRDSIALKEALANLPQRVFWLDGTETPIPRNTDQDVQQEDFSGKQHGHRLKNLTLCDAAQRIHYLSPTESGSRHDKTLADSYPLHLPAGSVLKQDLGFLGHQPAGVVIEMPFKKPKNRELTFSQKLYNQLLSSTRVIVEPHRRTDANSGLKRLRMLKDVCRVHHEVVRDRIRVVACGLHNLRVSGVDAARGYQTSSRLQAYITTFSE
jgi:hypothetical protein